MHSTPNCGTSFQCWSQYGQQIAASHASGVPSASVGSLPFYGWVTTTAASDSADLMGNHYITTPNTNGDGVSGTWVHLTGGSSGGIFQNPFERSQWTQNPFTPFVKSGASQGQPQGRSPNDNTLQTQQQKHPCSDLEKLAYAWHGVETVATVGLGVGTMVTGAAGWGAACVSGNPLLCVGATMAAPAYIVGGYLVTKSSLQELREPNNRSFGGDCQ